MSSHLPGVLGEIAAIADEDAALKIAAARGGTEIYIPAQPGADHWLVQLLGTETARAVCDRLGGLRIELPVGSARGVGRARADADRMIAEGKSEREIALATGYTIRTVRRRRAALSQRDDRQLSLL